MANGVKLETIVGIFYFGGKICISHVLVSVKVFYPQMLMNRIECCDDNHSNFSEKYNHIMAFV